MSTSNERIILNIGKRMVKVAVQEILYVVCEDYICSLTVSDGRTYQVSRSLQSVHEELDGCGFQYISRDVLVNMHHVVELQRTSARRWCAHLSNGSVFPVAARRQKGFREMFLTTRPPMNMTRSRV